MAPEAVSHWTVASSRKCVCLSGTSAWSRAEEDEGKNPIYKNIILLCLPCWLSVVTSVQSTGYAQPISMNLLSTLIIEGSWKSIELVACQQHRQQAQPPFDDTWLSAFHCSIHILSTVFPFVQTDAGAFAVFLFVSTLIWLESITSVQVKHLLVPSRFLWASLSLCVFTWAAVVVVECNRVMQYWSYRSKCKAPYWMLLNFVSVPEHSWQVKYCQFKMVPRHSSELNWFWLGCGLCEPGNK